jgi:hypothetical protein
MHSSSAQACYIPCPSHPPGLDHSDYTWRRVQVMRLLIIQFSPISYDFISHQSKYSPEHPVSLYSSLNIRDQVSHPYKSYTYIDIFAVTSRPALWPTQPPVQWVPCAVSLGAKWQGREADHSPLSSPEVKNDRSMPLSPYMSSWHGA